MRLKISSRQYGCSIALLLSLSACAGQEYSDEFEEETSSEDFRTTHIYNFEGADASQWGGTPLTTGVAHGNYGWVLASSGWNAMWHDLPTSEGLGGTCTATFTLSSSPNLTGGFASILNESGAILTEFSIPPNVDATFSLHYSVDGTGGRTFRAGFWGNGQSAFIAFDNLTIVCDLAPACTSVNPRLGVIQECR